MMKHQLVSLHGTFRHCQRFGKNQSALETKTLPRDLQKDQCTVSKLGDYSVNDWAVGLGLFNSFCLTCRCQTKTIDSRRSVLGLERCSVHVHVWLGRCCV